jgi:UDP-N-acetylglucosamine 1-carboxyvinyltransferase
MHASDAFNAHETLRQIGRLIRIHRLQKGWTQLDLALAVESHRTQIARIERGEQDVRVCTLTRIANALEIPVSDLVSPPPPDFR